MSVYFFETTDSDEHYLTERLPGETLRFHAAPLRTSEQVRAIAADAEIISPFVQSLVGADAG